MKKIVFYTLISASVMTAVSMASDKPLDEVLKDQSATPIRRVQAKEQLGQYKDISSPYSLQQTKEIDTMLFVGQRASFNARLKAEEEAAQTVKDSKAKIAQQDEKHEAEMKKLKQQLKASKAEELRLQKASQAVIELEAELSELKIKLSASENDKEGFQSQLEQNKEDLRLAVEAEEKTKLALIKAKEGALEQDETNKLLVTSLTLELEKQAATVKRREDSVTFTKKKLEEEIAKVLAVTQEVSTLTTQLSQEKVAKEELAASLVRMEEENKLLRKHLGILPSDTEGVFLPLELKSAGSTNSDGNLSDTDDAKLPGDDDDK